MESIIKRVPLGMFCLLAFKYLLKSGSWEEVAAMTVCAALAFAYESYSLAKHVKDLHGEIEKFRKENEKRDETITDVKTGLTGIRMGQKMMR